MDFDDYAQVMAKKYQLAVAIAVIRNKPENITPDQYIAQLKEKIVEPDSEINSSNVILSDDFNFDDNDFNFDGNDDRLVINNVNEIDAVLIRSKDDNNVLDDKGINRNVNKVTNNIAVAVSSDVSTEDANSLDDILRTLNVIDDSKGRKHNDNNPSQENSQIILTSFVHLNTIAEENLTMCDDNSSNNFDFIDVVPNDIEMTVDEKLKGIVAKNIKKTKISKPGVISEAPRDRHDDFYENVLLENTNEMEIDLELDEHEPEQFSNLNTDFVNEKAAIVTKNITKALNKRVCEENVEKTDLCNNLNRADNVNKNLNVGTANSVENGTQETIIYSLHGFTQNTSHVSQSQYENIEIPQAFIYGNKNIINRDCNYHKNQTNETVIDIVENNSNRNPREVTFNKCEIQYIIDETGKTYAVLQSILDKKAISKKKARTLNTKDTQAFTEVNNTNESQEACQNDENPNADIFESLNTDEYLDAEMDSEVVPFKVVKELSKIKAFLNKRERRESTDGFSSDSGYRSDSQNSYKCGNARLSEEWVGESAGCLYNYIIHCPLVAVTQDIVNEIALVLGRLIDRLHEKEKYPLFLEELLNKIESLLRELSEDGGEFENILLEKDETIQRLLLLNKSTHILKFSIEKIANILEKAHSCLTSEENLYELTNVTKVENLRYIFYILELLIQVYMKIKDTPQNTQHSQETKILKKSSISEIWKRKWYPDSKEMKNVGSQERGCVLNKCGEILNKCGEVLNKIVVDCMEGYALVSFAALQCFNTLQS